MDAKNPVQSVEISVRIIELLKDLDSATVTDLAKRMDVTKGAVHHHLSTLESKGFVVQKNNKYNLGIRFFEFGEYVKNQRDIYEIAVPQVEKLAEETGELGNLLIEEHGRGTYLYRARGEQALSLDTGVGARVYLHNTALGKSILAYMARDRVNEILDQHGMEKKTENTITDRDELFDQLSDIRERGVAYDFEERAIGVQCVAAPIQTTDGQVLGAVSVAGPTSRMQLEEDASELSELVSNTADVISINATYS